MGTIQKHAREVLAALGRDWVCDGTTSKGHYRMRHIPTGAVIVAAGSTANVRAIAQSLQNARRAIRETQERQRQGAVP